MRRLTNTAPGSSTLLTAECSTIVNSSNRPPFTLTGPFHWPMNFDASPKAWVGTNTIHFIAKVAYNQLVCMVRPEKKESNCTRFTVCGDHINYPGKLAPPTADMLRAKNPVQQSHFHTWCQVHDHGYL
eukprot:CCRYP_002170-RB/>CCRYP_002170-RB protein AED:0.44 eAED:0.44 QI:0/0/0/1/0/0/2/0/127